MKLITFILTALFSISAFTEERFPRFNRDDVSTGGLRTVWSCPINRGDMPELREVEIFYETDGKIAFRPDIFRASSNAITALESFFSGRKSSSNVDECLRSFMSTIPQAVANFQAARCSGSPDLTCTKSAQDILLEAGRKIRRSSFYRRYQNDLASVEDLLPVAPVPPRQVTRIVTPDPTPNVGPMNNRPNVEIILPRPEENPDRARTRLLDYMIDNFSKFEDIKQYASFCPNMGSTTGQHALYCQDRHTRNNAFLTNLSQMFTAVRGEPISQARLLQSIECLPPSVSEFRDLDDILNKMDEKDDCGVLTNVGDHKLFRKAPSGDPAWYTSGNYLLKKTATDTYEATLNLDFVNRGGALNSQQMLAKVQGCLNEASPYMRGPGGTRLNIRALSPAEIESQLPRSERPLPGTINVLPDEVRAQVGNMVSNVIDASNFTSNINCPTVTHEILHHLGLCDEYQESRTDIIPGMTRSRSVEWSCRVVPNGPSFMKSLNEAYNRAVVQQLSCDCVNESCRNAMLGSDPRSVANRKLLMSSTLFDVFGSLSSHCATPVYLPTVDDVPNPDKAFTNIEYNGGVLNFQTRSLMSENGRFRIARKNITCTCPAGDVNCPAALAEAVTRMGSSPQIFECPLHTQPSSAKTAATVGSTTSFHSNGFNMVSTPVLPSLLTPNQFDKILTGNCRQGPSSMYKKCAEFSYMAQDSSACSEKPADCSDDTQFLGRSREE